MDIAELKKKSVAELHEMAEELNITREEQDAFALESHRRAVEAINAGPAAFEDLRDELPGASVERDDVVATARAYERLGRADRAVRVYERAIGQLFLEEAAGISKYKERRRETERRIQHTRDNLSRLTDLREEVGKHLSRLKRQANAAERYKKLKQERRELASRLAALQWKHLMAEVEAGRFRRLDSIMSVLTVPGHNRLTFMLAPCIRSSRWRDSVRATTACLLAP